MGGAALQQAVREAAGRGADVEAAAPRNRYGERVEGVGELDAAARNEWRRAVDIELDGRVDELARLLRPPAPRADMDLAGQHGGGGAGAGLEEAALRQQ